jgi:hypothetical protein
MAKNKYVTSGSNIQELITAVQQQNKILEATQQDTVVDTRALTNINNVIVDVYESISAIEKIIVGNHMKDLESAREQAKYNDDLLDAIRGLKPKAPETKEKDKGEFSWLGLAGALIGGLVMGGLAFVKNYIKGIVAFWTKIGKALKVDVLIAKLFSYIKAPFELLRGGFIRVIDYVRDLFKGSDLLRMFKTNVIRLFSFIGEFFGFSGKGLFKDFVRMFESVGQMIGSTAKAIGGFFAKIFSLGGGEGGLFSKIAKAMDFFGPLTKFFKTFGSILGKLAYPIQLVLSLFDTVTGALDGWNNTQGGFMDKLFGAIKGGLTGLLNGLIGGLLDLLKDGLVWILDALGFDKAVKFLESFSFTDLIGKLVGGYVDMIKGMVDWVMMLFTNPKAAMEKLGEGLMKMGDMAKNFLKAILRMVLPNPEGGTIAKIASKAIPDSVYEFAGMNPKTGAILTDATVDNVAAKGEKMVNEAAAAGQAAVGAVVNSGQTIINNGNTAVVSSRSKVTDMEDMWARGGMSMMGA